ATLAVGAPALGLAAAAPFGAVAVGAFLTSGGPVFELFAREGDRQEGRLASLAGFALAATGLALLTPAFGMPVGVFVATVLLVGYGNLGDALARAVRGGEFPAATGFVVAGTLAAVAGQLAPAAVAGRVPAVTPTAVFLGASGALLAALVRSVFVGREDALVVLSVGMALWLLADVGTGAGWTTVGVGLAVTAGFGYLSWTLGTASVPGMLTGVLLGLLTVVLGGYGWFAVLIAFFGVGGLSAKYRYDEKLDRGVAEPQGGARGSGNVLGNAAPAVAAVVLFAASGRLPLPRELFLYAFTGSLATALGDTLSSEIGGLYDKPRLVTTLDAVPPGTDGAVTWQGELAGLAGAAAVAGLAGWLFSLPLAGAVLVVGAGLVGMTTDSLLGATVEGGRVGNQAVNFLATATGAVVGAAFALAAGLL
ncbi:MAG: TIGR00297 family protein, partial [Halobacteriaceae archaeon]